MEYQVPQFIDVEDKLVGPLTLKQFIYLAGAGGLCVIFFSFLPFIIAGILSLAVGGLGVGLAFYKINGKPFIEVLEAGFAFYTSKRMMLWKYAPKGERANQAAAAAAAAEDAARASAAAAQLRIPRLTRGKLSELAWSLDVKGPPTHLRRNS